MIDVSKTIAPKSDQLNADDLIGGAITVKITDVREVGKSDDQPIAIYFEGDKGRPFKPCKTMRKILVWLWESDGKAYIGRSFTLYNDPTVMWGGVKVGGIRISHMSHIDKTQTRAFLVTRGNSKPFTIKPLQVQDAAPAQDKPKDSGNALKLAKIAANEGTEAFKEWWNSDEGKNVRHIVKGDMPELQEICKTADIMIDTDPFGLPPIEGETSDETTGDVVE